MTSTPARSAEHTAVLHAPPERAYRLIADVTHWPLLFPPCVGARLLESGPDFQRIRLWAVVGTEVRSWTSLRELDDRALRIGFRQEVPSPPVTSMGGHWQFTADPGAPGTTRLVLGHTWSTAGSDTDADRIAAALDHNSDNEIRAVKSWAERPEDPSQLLFSFTDRVFLAGERRDVYDFLYRADLWPERLAHVVHTDVETAVQSPASAGADVQTLDMETLGPDGSTHTTQSIRLCFPGERILYKQTTVPHGLLAHSGEWLLTEASDGTHVIARHDVALDPSALVELLGPGADLADARRQVRASLGGNSLRTLDQARLHVAGAAREGAV
ncbi:hypothetical protein GCM10023084_24320 [Streptomyces lacrimifluminis]|uniref:Coenzyme Q-binding protein COQ10 START domain-containing protein n=1 Tax=Streptomyces lacrimifluminis TaxID=1500077 RepID=A0A917KI07_9ACTN|nr:aromatase/cyclase [Streptomyces lacrimifluminis]GGJ14893.1 hypothetical protein GCM10012282_08940 [Streptomyces lacrimifluminis]